MATTITYKGSDLTSFSNTSKTLRTAGKYLEGDITITAGLDVNNQNKTVVPSETTQSITADTGYTGLGTVTVNGITSTYVGSGINRQTPSNVAISYNSSSDRLNINVPTGYYESTDSVVKRVDLILPTQTATTIIPSESQQTTVDIHKWTTGTVTVAAITPTYVGSSVPAGSLTVSGPTVTASAGYYADAATTTVPSATLLSYVNYTSANSPTVTIDSSGLVTATVNQAIGDGYRIVINPGYVSSSAYVGITSPARTTTYQLDTQAATTITPSSATQTVTGQKYMTGDITVQPIPSQYIVPSGTYTITSVDSTNTFNVTNYASAKVTITDADSIAY